MSPRRVNWALVVSVVALLLMILGAVISHAVMNERRLTALELQIRACLADEP